uniref:Uncharacterized protein n=1 Tax=Parascaris univalens TaxID=6257 RepID=A0A914ZFX9_PARUN
LKQQFNNTTSAKFDSQSTRSGSSQPAMKGILSALSVADLTSTALTGPLWAGAERASLNDDSASISSSEHSHR